jgi:hypothetical protein
VAGTRVLDVGDLCDRGVVPGQDSSGYTRVDAIGLAETYLQGGLVAHSSTLPRLAPGCFRHENGWATGDAEVIRGHFPFMTMCVGLRQEQWLVELPHVAVRYELLLDGASGRTMPVAEFFTVGPDGIEEIAAVFPLSRWMDNAVAPATEAVRAPRVAVPRGQAEADTVALASELVAAIIAGEKTPCGDDVTVAENGVLLARGAEAASSAFRAGIWSAIVTARPQEWVAEGFEALGRLEFDVDDGELVAAAVYVRRYGTQAREVELTWGPGPGPRLAAEWRSHARLSALGVGHAEAGGGPRPASLPRPRCDQGRRGRAVRDRYQAHGGPARVDPVRTAVHPGTRDRRLDPRGRRRRHRAGGR